MPKLKTITLPDNITYDIDTTYVAGDGLNISGADNEISVVYGTSANTACEGNDIRLSDSRNAKDVYDWAKAAVKPSYTSSEVGAIDSTLKGSSNGVAELDENGLVPASQLPSYVDDVVEGYYYNNSFYEDSAHTQEIIGESGKIYLDLTEDITYRWGGSAWVKMASPLALGETSSTAYRGDRGAVAYTHATDSNRIQTANTLDMYKFSTTSEGHVGNVSPITTSDINPLVVVSKTQAEYNALTTDEKMNGMIYDITDADSYEDSLLWTKVGKTELNTTNKDLSNALNEIYTITGNTTLTTTSQDLTSAVNELNSSLNSFNFRFLYKPWIYELNAGDNTTMIITKLASSYQSLTLFGTPGNTPAIVILFVRLGNGVTIYDPKGNVISSATVSADGKTVTVKFTNKYSGGVIMTNDYISNISYTNT